MSRAIVVLPTYNEVENLPLIVPDILSQDPTLEVLVVDDHSPDGTGELADQLANEDSRVHVLHRSHKEGCLLYTSPSPRDATLSRMPSSA